MQEMQETWVQSLDQEDPGRRKWQPTPIFLPGESLWAEEPGGLQSVGLQRVGQDLVTKQQILLWTRLCVGSTYQSRGRYFKDQ